MAIVLFILLVNTVLHNVGAYDRPIIGVVAQKSRIAGAVGDTVMSAAYIKWVESAGARLVPIRDNEADEYYEQMFQYTNGIFLQGGGSHMFESGYSKVSRMFLNMAIQAFDDGDYYPIWGTCRGLQQLLSLVDGTDVTTATGVMDKSLPLNFTEDYKESRLFGNLPKDVETYIRKKDVTPNFHKQSVLMQTYMESPRLKTFFRVLSTNIATNGKKFISTVEAYKYPVYAIQWHPEKNNFIWNSAYKGLAHTYEGVRVSQHFANFFVSEARKNNHRFPDAETEAQIVINNYQVWFSRNSDFVEKYYINYTQLCSSDFTVKDFIYV